jgi:TolB-like protein/Tfp pilus assembly protein PilF
VLHATVYEQPPALTGSDAVIAVDRVIRRALAKKPAERPASATEMAGALRSIPTSSVDRPSLARPLTRLVVLPFRVMRTEAESDFLAFSLPDAIATSLSRIGPIVVRSSAVAARFLGEAPDLKALAAEADVDRVVTGTLLRSGDEVRAAVQLVEAPAGTILASLTVQSPFGDLFRLQDDIARRVVEALSLPLAGATPPARHAPHDARAYELYLRANELARTYDGIPRAHELYRRALDLDPSFAPAWAQLGRCRRVIGKYIGGLPDSQAQAELAFRRALELDPRLTIAHKYYAQLEADIGQAPRALQRLLGEAHRHGNDPELFAGLVHACRYCGLYDQSIAAHTEARRLDPNVPTSLGETLLVADDVERLLSLEGPILVTGGNRVVGLGLAGRRDEARAALADLRRALEDNPVFMAWIEYLTAWLDRRPEAMVFDASVFDSLTIQEDPEAVFQEGWLLCEVGRHERGLECLQRAIARGYWAAPLLASSRHFDALRSNPAFRMLLAAAEAGRNEALATFREAGGDRLLGMNLAVA